MMILFLLLLMMLLCVMLLPMMLLMMLLLLIMFVRSDVKMRVYDVKATKAAWSNGCDAWLKMTRLVVRIPPDV